MQATSLKPKRGRESHLKSKAIPVQILTLMLRVRFPSGLAIRKKELPVTVLDGEK
jgi:hypothetical protein